ncbi:MAG TPA: hypothetical protein VHI13_12280 [Candidatus Kapabacteria bacterium]|nr:hypothetical protein [Candidatus Kapabacteria bacterium]
MTWFRDLLGFYYTMRPLIVLVSLLLFALTCYQFSLEHLQMPLGYQEGFALLGMLLVFVVLMNHMLRPVITPPAAAQEPGQDAPATPRAYELIPTDHEVTQMIRSMHRMESQIPMGYTQGVLDCIGWMVCGPHIVSPVAGAIIRRGHAEMEEQYTATDHHDGDSDASEPQS